MVGIKSFFGYIFLLLAALLTITQAILFPFPDYAGMGVVGGGSMFLLFIITILCILGGILGLDSKEQTMGKKIATVGALMLCVGLVLLMAGLVLANSAGMSAPEYFVLLFYMVSFGGYGFIGTGAL